LEDAERRAREHAEQDASAREETDRRRARALERAERAERGRTAGPPPEAPGPRTTELRAHPAQRRTSIGWMPSEMVIGSFLFVFGITLAVLILTGAVRLGFAP
jgi:hypothetical protein